ncbi:hypothetical protein AgCh_000348 [Apium graveolens]
MLTRGPSRTTFRARNVEFFSQLILTNPYEVRLTDLSGPRRLFPVEDNPPPEGSQLQKPPVKRKRRIIKDTRSRVLTEKGKQVLSSDARLDLQKLRQKKLLREQEIEGTESSDEELKLLEAETNRLEAKLEKIKEIHH